MLGSRSSSSIRKGLLSVPAHRETMNENRRDHLRGGESWTGFAGHLSVPLLERDLAAALTTEWINAIHVRIGRQRQAINVSLAASKVDVVNLDLIFAVRRRVKRMNESEPKRVVIFRRASAPGIKHFQTRIERRAQAGGVNFATNRLSLARHEGPDVYILAGEDAAIDRSPAA